MWQQVEREEFSNSRNSREDRERVATAPRQLFDGLPNVAKRDAASAQRSAFENGKSRSVATAFSPAHAYFDQRPAVDRYCARGYLGRSPAQKADRPAVEAYHPQQDFRDWRGPFRAFSAPGL